MNVSAGSASLLVAAADLRMIQSLIAAIDAPAPGLAAGGSWSTPAARYEPRPVIHPTPRYLPRPVLHPTPRYLARPVIHPTPRYENPAPSPS
ncbi:MAG TPA: hypothetical protein VG722_04295, partial [Tepidisphaeraceae bacterium]|nr:hypothetical protein [Tepidisphaeraceae bacterium]